MRLKYIGPLIGEYIDFRGIILILYLEIDAYLTNLKFCSKINM